MFFIPLAVAFGWPAPNYTDPVTRGPELWIVTGLFLFAATLCVSIRLYWRIFLRRWLGIDDILIVLALVSVIAMLKLS
jgi:glucan phosphoethanolaminetransferase (alkaline phosphatase superfamily)